jgi:phosphoribosylformimino-5-aminoimidazole carboxamide ribotide isomerase
MTVIPAIDLRDGRCVRLCQGDFERQTTYSDVPSEVALEFQNLGLTSLHIVDLDGARHGLQCNTVTIKELLEVGKVSIQLGGGIRDAASIRHWLACGVSRCVVGSMAVNDPETVKSWFHEFGAPQIVLALDVRISANSAPKLATHGWTKTTRITLWDCIESYLDVGLKQVLCTDISRDGALTGPNFELYRDLQHRYPELELQASGGVRNLADLQALSEIGVHATITGRALLDGRIGKEELQSFLPAA